MSSPEIATAPTKPSLAQDWLNAVRYWLRGRNGVIVLIVLALVIGAALNWSWLVAVGVAPLLITILPCAVMCALGLCMNKMVGRTCSTETHPVAPPKPGARVTASVESGESGPAPLLSDTPARPDVPAAGPAVSVAEPRNPRKGADMSKHLRTLAISAAVVAGLTAAPALYAQDHLSMPHGSMMGEGMMGEGGMMGMMGGMMSGMMGMSGDMGAMMSTATR